MDLRFLDATPTGAERAAVDAVLGPPPSGWEGGARTLVDTRVARTGAALRERRDLLLPALHALNQRVGWLTQGGMNYVCQRLQVPPAEAYGVASFYALFSTEPRPARVVHVCTDIACRSAVPEGEAFLASPCLGLCEAAPAALMTEAGETPVGLPGVHVDSTSIRRAAETGRFDVDSTYAGPATAVRSAGALLRRVGVVDPGSLGDYRAHGGYEALRRAFALGPAGVIRELNDSGLVGRGGAAFPTGRKWDAVARQPVTERYVVVNADESEPGTFKDRVVVEGDPFAVVETATIAGFACGAERGFVYLRGEYPLAAARLQSAIDECYRHGLLGAEAAGRNGFRFDLEIRLGAGAYICGEETAIFNSIEGERGEPRNKPPFPVEVGLFGKPTVVNNVETLVNVAPILLGGGAGFAERETKLFCVSGALDRPGVYEVPFGATTLRGLLADAGCVFDTLQAVLLGGAAGMFVGPDELDLPLTFAAARAAGVTLGSGVVMAFDRSVDLGAVLQRIAHFFRDESCGQCVPCRVGTMRQEELLGRLATGQAQPHDLELFDEISRAMKDASICGLGQTATSAVESALRRFPLFDRPGAPA